MPYVFVYLLKFSLSLAMLYTFYRLLLRPLTFYQWNRFYLLGYTLLSLAMPFLNITPWLNETPVINSRLVSSIPVVDQMTSPGDLQPEDAFFKPDLWTLVSLLLVGGALVVLYRLVLQYRSLRSLRKTAVLISANDAEIYHVNDAVGPFSFGNRIFVNTQAHSDDELQKIIAHEMVHVRQKHTIDIMLTELLCVINWFNPFAWLIRHAVRQNLEFIADRNVLARGLDARQYQYLLLKVVGIPQYGIASNFNFSSLKKRIAMINKIKTGKAHLVKFLFIAPMLGVMLLAFRSGSATPGTLNAALQTETIFPGLAAGLDTVPKPAPVAPLSPGEPKAAPSPAPVPATPAVPAVPATPPVPPVDAVEKVPDVHAKPAKTAVKPVITARTTSGKVTQYDLNDPAQQLAFETDFGYQRAAPAKSVGGSVLLQTLVRPNSTHGPAQPLYIVDGVSKSKHEIQGIKGETISSITVLKGEQAVSLFGKAGSDGVILMTTKDNKGENMTIATEEIGTNSFRSFEGMYVVDGKEITKEAFKAIPPDQIEMMDVLKGVEAEKLYKDKGRNGVILITTRKAN